MIYRPKLDSLITFTLQKVLVYLQLLLRNPPRKATEYGEITRRLGLLRRSRSSKVTEFGANRKLICDFLLVINTNLPPILHRFHVMAHYWSNFR